METKISLRDLEQDMFRSSIQDGIIDIQIGCMLLIFVIAPLLSKSLGDFWSSMIFLPIWGVIFLGLRAFKKKHLQPRVGIIQYGTYRKKLLKKLHLVILVFNLAVLVLGVISFILFSFLAGWIFPAILSILLLIGFSLAGYMLEFPRLYLYGIVVSAAPLVGEFLYQSFGFSHHGIPVTFGITATSFILTGIVILYRIMKQYPLPPEGIA